MDEAARGTGPYRYEVPKSGYYCVGTVPVSLQQSRYNSSYAGVVDFEGNYGGHLPGSEYPKIPVSFDCEFTSHEFETYEG